MEHSPGGRLGSTGTHTVLVSLSRSINGDHEPEGAKAHSDRPSQWLSCVGSGP